jgi:hypothetical protein
LIFCSSGHAMFLACLPFQPLLSFKFVFKFLFKGGSGTSNLIGCLILVYCIILCFEPGFWMLIDVNGLCEVTNH